MTGLPAGLPVVGGGGDQAASGVGTGIVEPGLVSVTMGTSGVVFAYTDSPSATRRAPAHLLPRRARQVARHGGDLSAGGSLRWLRDALGAAKSDVAALTGVDPYEILTAEADQVPAGSEGLLFLPYLTGERTPYPDPTPAAVFLASPAPRQAPPGARRARGRGL
jgi:xylulokinase